VSLYPQKFPYRLAQDWTWTSKPTCSRMTDTASGTECLSDKDVLTSKLAVNSNQTSHKISTSWMTFCKVWIVVLAKQEKIPARNACGCTYTRFHSKWCVALTHPEGHLFQDYRTYKYEYTAHIYVTLTPSSNVCFGLEYDHKLTKQYNTQFIGSQLQTPDVFGLCVVE
jgi:hypothetical protein